MKAQRKKDAAQIEGLDHEEMRERANHIECQLRVLEEELRRKNIEYEAVEKEVVRARNREEGILKAIGSTLKDTFQKHLGQ